MKKNSIQILKKKVFYKFKKHFKSILGINASTLITLSLQALFLILSTKRVSADIFGLSSFLILISNFFRIFTAGALNTTILQKGLDIKDSIKIIKKSSPVIIFLLMSIYSLLILTSPQKIFFKDYFSCVYPLILLLFSIFFGYLNPITRIDLLRREITYLKISKIDSLISVISILVSIVILYSHLSKFLIIECFTSQQIITGISYSLVAYYQSNKFPINEDLRNKKNTNFFISYLKNCITELSLFLSGNIDRYFTLYVLSPTNYGVYILTRRLVSITFQIYNSISLRYIQPYLAFNSASKNKNYIYLILTNLFSISVIMVALSLSKFFPNTIPYSNNLFYGDFLKLSCSIFLLRSSLTSIYFSIISKPNGNLSMRISLYSLSSSLIAYLIIYLFFFKNEIYFFIFLISYLTDIIIWLYYFKKLIYSKSTAFYFAISSTLINVVISIYLTLSIGSKILL